MLVLRYSRALGFGLVSAGAVVAGASCSAQSSAPGGEGGGVTPQAGTGTSVAGGFLTGGSATFGGAPPVGTGGTTSVGGSPPGAGAPPVAGSVGIAGTPGAAGAPATGCTPQTTPQTCAHTLAPKATLIDFSTYSATGTWGASASGDLTGGTSPFQGTGVTALTRLVEGAAPDTTLHVTGMVPNNNYAGFVFWFGPCVNAAMVMGGTTPTTGLAVPIGGTLGGARLKLQVQTHATYPIDPTNMKGGCPFVACTTRYTECVPPTYTMTTIPATRTLTNFPWTNFLGGLPATSPTTNGDGIVGLQFQFECPVESGCSVDLTLGAVVLTL